MKPVHIAAFATLLLASCATDDRDFGRVVQDNIIAHAVELEPDYAGVPIEGGSGQRAAGAVGRYRRGAVKEAAGGGAGGGAAAGAAPAAAAPN